ncbi:hypothetical protein F4777DRAFT_378934 [Nemania sp. FL0916]|nr:hypothetical protein F4777DRAFT_378934 [Nemania sp. FL0916]
MSRTLEPTLYSLLPNYSTALPQRLLDLASSLLAQSRQNAGVLKADEEVARSYACAHLACERLKITLNLPPIQVRPPIPPRLYKRLYAHLENVLPPPAVATPARVRTPSSKARDSGLFSSAKRTPSGATPTKETTLFGSAKRIPSRPTPTKAASLAKVRSPAAAKVDKTPTKSGSRPSPHPAKKRKVGGSDSALPPWIRPTIQLLCKELDQELIGRTVLAGCQTIVAPHGKRTTDEWVNEHLAPLVAAVYCLVAGQLHVLVQGKDLDNRQYSKIRKSVLAVLETAHDHVAISGVDEDELWIGWSDIAPKEVDLAMGQIIKRGWQKDEWFAGFDDMVKRSELNASNSGDDDDEDNDNEDENISEKLHIQRADTMFQSRWDMTDQKRRDYREWKDEILQRIEEKEQLQATAMEIDSAA